MKLSWLTTGEELLYGDVINQNSPVMSKICTAHGYRIQHHLTCGDHPADITEALRFLSQHADVIIITGGLGPTSDDNTRYALSTHVQRPLMLDETSFIALETFYHQRDYNTLTPLMRQQALFPEGAHVFPAIYGTAPGCRVEKEEKTYFMLPGPPKECMPMFERDVLPWLLEHATPTLYIHKWEITGFTESQIAHELDALIHPKGLATGFRWEAPILEFKIFFPIDYASQPVIEEITQWLAEKKSSC